MASKTTFREISRYAPSSVNGTFHRVVKVINGCDILIIKWNLDYASLAGQFGSIAQLPGIVGAVDGSYIPIRVPANVQKDYLNRKMTHSMLLIAICDAQMLFTNVVTGFPRSLHDQRAFSMTTIGDAVSVFPN